MAKLLLKFGEAVIKEIAVDKDVISIGRKPGNDVQIDNLAVSGFHAKVVREAGQFFVEDLNSTNGTFISGRRISKAPLKNNDEVTVGKHILKFMAPEADKAATADATVKAKKEQLHDTVVLSPAKMSKPEEQGEAHAAPKLRMGVMTVVSGATDQLKYELKEKLITIGKVDSAQIKLKGFFAPDVAALINRVKDDYFISPPGSGKKPMVNGANVETRQLLKEGDVIDLGKVKLQFSISE